MTRRFAARQALTAVAISAGGWAVGAAILLRWAFTQEIQRS